MNSDKKLEINNSICRACLSLKATIKMFSIHKRTALQYSSIFTSCLSLKVEPEDGLPQLICKRCSSKLITFHKFKSIVAQNDLILRESIQHNDKTIEPELEVTEDKEEQSGVKKCPLKDTVKKLHSLSQDFIRDEIKREQPEEFDIKSQGCFEKENSDIDFPISNAQKIKLKGELGKTTHQCDVCGKILSCKSNLNQHLRKHTGERRHSCDMCGKKFFKAEHVTVHRRTHTGERPHHCMACPKKFVQYAALKAHLRTHSGERPHMCSVCGKSFSQLSTLSYHTRIHSGETPFTCKLCGKGFKNTGNLNIHKRFHNNERPFSCKLCEKSFVTSSHLKVHINQHNGIKSHQCIICGKAFARGEHLKDHMVIHTGQKPHACKLCSKKYTQSSHLTRHMKTHKTV